MIIYLNKIPINIEDSNTPLYLNKFLEKQDIKSTIGVAVALNQNIIPKDKWGESILKDGDNIVVIGAYYGG